MGRHGCHIVGYDIHIFEPVTSMKTLTHALEKFINSGH